MRDWHRSSHDPSPHPSPLGTRERGQERAPTTGRQPESHPLIFAARAILLHRMTFTHSPPRTPAAAPRTTSPASVAVVIPAWNEEGSIGRVIHDLPRAWVARIIVADNNSTD